MKKRTLAALAPAATLAGIALQDLLQKEHALRRNFPVIARLRYLLESVGPELRQYIITSNDSERPFSRDQRRWVYTSAKKENNYFAFGTDNDTENAALSHHQAGHLLRRRGRLPDPRPRHRGAGREGARRSARAPARVSAGVGRQRVGDVVRVAQSAGDSRRSTRPPRSPTSGTTPARAACRTTTARAATSSSRSAPATSAAATSTATSISTGWSTSSAPAPCARSRSS